MGVSIQKSEVLDDILESDVLRVCYDLKGGSNIAIYYAQRANAMRICVATTPSYNDLSRMLRNFYIISVPIFIYSISSMR